MFEVLNLTVQACAVKVIGSIAGFGDFIEENNNIFGVGASIEESSYAFVVGELSLFRRLFISFVTCVDPLTWWQIHETQFPNVRFFVKQILRILRSQIEIEHVFNLVGVLTTLKCCRLQVDNLD
jgi:hypothetical protein